MAVSPMSARDRSFFQVAIAKEKLRHVLGTPFGSDGRIPDVTTEERNWAFDVVRDKPEWAHGVLREFSIEVPA